MNPGIEKGKRKPILDRKTDRTETFVVTMCWEVVGSVEANQAEEK